MLLKNLLLKVKIEVRLKF